MSNCISYPLGKRFFNESVEFVKKCTRIPDKKVMDMADIARAVACIQKAHEYSKDQTSAFDHHDISAYIADSAMEAYREKNSEELSPEQFDVEEQAALTHTTALKQWHIGQVLDGSMQYLFAVKIDDGLYYRYRECKAYQLKCHRDLTEEEIQQFLCSNCDYKERALSSTFTEFNYSVCVSAYQYLDSYAYVASFPGYPGICGQGQHPQEAVEKAYDNLSKAME